MAGFQTSIALCGLWVRIGSYDDTAIARIAPFEDVELEVGLLSPPISGH